MRALTRAALPIAAAAAHFLLAAGVVLAQPDEAARAAFAEGRFTEAAALAEALGTSNGHALAAKSLSIHGHHLADDAEKPALFERAAGLAREAIRLDPVNPEAHLQLGHALGRHGQLLGVLQAAAEGYGEKVRDAIKEALRLDPDMAGAHLALATWHAEAASTGGFMARMLYGATGKDAIRHYEKAVELAPGNKVALAEYAFGLLLLNRDRNRERARDLLTRAIGLPPADAYDRLVHGQAVERLAGLDRPAPRPQDTHTGGSDR